MAEKLTKFDWTQSSRLTSGEKATYPWADWLDGDIWQITQGEDFDTHPLMMERIIRTRVTSKKARVQLRHLPLNGDPTGIIVLQRTDIEGPTQVKRDEAKAKRLAKRNAAEQEAADLVRDIKPKRAAAASKRPSRTPTKRPAKTAAAA